MAMSESEEAVARAAEAFLDGLEQSYPAWAEMVVQRVEAIDGEIHPFERAQMLREAELRLRASGLESLMTIENAVGQFREDRGDGC